MCCVFCKNSAKENGMDLRLYCCIRFSRLFFFAYLLLGFALFSCYMMSILFMRRLASDAQDQAMG